VSTRTAPVIAVFGSGDHTDVAEALGAEIARRSCILLTGGGRGADGPAVTESGLAGAEAARRDEGLLGARVGVLRRRKGDERVEVDVEDGDTKIVLDLAVGHRRNYLNAHLCDAAIALDGGEGTKSEVAFCLALGRPVVLVGPVWGGEFPVTRTHEAYDAFVGAAHHRVPPDRDNGPVELNRRIGRAYEALADDFRKGARLDVVHRPIDAPPEALVREAEAAALRVGPVGGLPDLGDAERRSVADRYGAWLRAVDARLGPTRTP
jgi:uncharacterized protein (TIGR00725 family)